MKTLPKAGDRWRSKTMPGEAHVVEIIPDGGHVGNHHIIYKFYEKKFCRTEETFREYFEPIEPLDATQIRIEAKELLEKASTISWSPENLRRVWRLLQQLADGDF